MIESYRACIDDQTPSSFSIDELQQIGRMRETVGTMMASEIAGNMLAFMPDFFSAKPQYIPFLVEKWRRSNPDTHKPSAILHHLMRREPYTGVVNDHITTLAAHASKAADVFDFLRSDFFRTPLFPTAEQHPSAENTNIARRALRIINRKIELVREKEARKASNTPPDPQIIKAQTLGLLPLLYRQPVELNDEETAAKAREILPFLYLIPDEDIREQVAEIVFSTNIYELQSLIPPDYLLDVITRNTSNASFAMAEIRHRLEKDDQHMAGAIRDRITATPLDKRHEPFWVIANVIGQMDDPKDLLYMIPKFSSPLLPKQDHSPQALCRLSSGIDQLLNRERAMNGLDRSSRSALYQMLLRSSVELFKRQYNMSDWNTLILRSHLLSLIETALRNHPALIRDTYNRISLSQVQKLARKSYHDEDMERAVRYSGVRLTEPEAIRRINRMVGQ